MLLPDDREISVVRCSAHAINGEVSEKMTRHSSSFQTQMAANLPSAEE